MSRETLTLPRNRVGRMYEISDGTSWRIEGWTGEFYEVRCMGGPPNSPYSEGDRQRLRTLPSDGVWA